MTGRVSHGPAVRRHESGAVPSAFVAAPVAGSLAFAVIVTAFGGPGYDMGAYLVLGFVLAIFGAVPTAIVFGVPAWLFLRRYRLDPFVSALAGLLVAVAPWFLALAWSGGFSDTSFRLMLAVAASGVAAGLVFWKMTFGQSAGLSAGRRS